MSEHVGSKVVRAAEMARVEKLAVQSGCSEESFIDEAGKGVAAVAIQFIEERRLQKRVSLLIGKGNKGADAYAAGTALLEEGFRVRAFACFPPEACSEWNRKKREAFTRKRGQVISSFDGEEFQFEEGLIIDGLLGTGFQDSPKGQVETAIRVANHSRQPILAIDLPSGLDGTTGEVRGACIEAAVTVTLGMAKIGLFLREGWNVTGRLVVKDFGLPQAFVDLAEEVAKLAEKSRLSLPKIVRNRHKYQAGYVVGLSGSDTMKGAPKMAGLAALRAGAGIVRVFHQGEIGETPMELICQKWNEKAWQSELKRAGAVFAGPGWGKGLGRKIKGLAVPAVFDADALEKDAIFPERSILTPHRGEMLRLLGLTHSLQEEELLARCHKFAKRRSVVLVLKGAPTFLFGAGKPPLIIGRGDPGMATAGSGDVLTGILAALLAQKMEPYEAALTGAYLHAVAGEMAAKVKTSYGLIARDLIEHLPDAFQDLMERE